MKTSSVAAVLAVAIVAAVAVYWFFVRDGAPAPSAPGAPVTPPVGEAIEKPSLGSELFEKAANPIKDAMSEPASVAPGTNPIQGAYTNPFE